MMFAEDTLEGIPDCPGREIVSSEDKTYFGESSKLFFNSVRFGVFPSFQGMEGDDGRIRRKAFIVKCGNDHQIRGMNQFVLQQQASLLQFPISLDGSIHVKPDHTGLCRLSMIGKSKYSNYRFAAAQSDTIPKNYMGNKLNFDVPENFTAVEYLGKWLAASKVGGTFITSFERNSKAARLIMRELLRGEEKDFVHNAYKLGYEAESESNKLLKILANHIKNQQQEKKDVRYVEEECCFEVS